MGLMKTIFLINVVCVYMLDAVKWKNIASNEPHPASQLHRTNLRLHFPVPNLYNLFLPTDGKRSKRQNRIDLFKPWTASTPQRGALMNLVHGDGSIRVRPFQNNPSQSCLWYMTYTQTPLTGRAGERGYFTDWCKKNLPEAAVAPYLTVDQAKAVVKGDAIVLNTRQQNQIASALNGRQIEENNSGNSEVPRLHFLRVRRDDATSSHTWLSSTEHLERQKRQLGSLLGGLGGGSPLGGLGGNPLGGLGGNPLGGLGGNPLGGLGGGSPLGGLTGGSPLGGGLGSAGLPTNTNPFLPNALPVNPKNLPLTRTTPLCGPFTNVLHNSHSPYSCYEINQQQQGSQGQPPPTQAGSNGGGANCFQVLVPLAPSPEFPGGAYQDSCGRLIPKEDIDALLGENGNANGNSNNNNAFGTDEDNDAFGGTDGFDESDFDEDLDTGTLDFTEPPEPKTRPRPRPRPRESTANNRRGNGEINTGRGTDIDAEQLLLLTGQGAQIDPATLARLAG